jgi:hypothetical protein
VPLQRPSANVGFDRPQDRSVHCTL